MDFKKGNKIYFTSNPKLNSKNTYEVLSVIGEGADAKIQFINLQSKNKFEYSGHQMSIFGGQIRESLKEVSTIAPPVQVLCKHPADQIQIVKFSTFSFKQCKLCKKDLGNA